MKIEAGQRFHELETGKEFEVQAHGEFRGEGEEGWTPCIIYRPILSGAEIAEAAEAGRTTWFVQPTSWVTQGITTGAIQLIP